MTSPAASASLPPPPSRPPPPKRVKSEEDSLRTEVLREQLKFYKARNEELATLRPPQSGGASGAA